MAPEQAAGRPLDGRADVYAVGVMLWQMVAGRHPLGEVGGDPAQQLARIQRGLPPVPAPAEGELAALIEQACAVDPARRFARAGALRDALEAYRGRRGLGSDPAGLGAVVREVLAGGSAAAEARGAEARGEARGAEARGAEAPAGPAAPAGPVASARRIDDGLAAVLGRAAAGGPVGRTTVPATRGTGAADQARRDRAHRGGRWRVAVAGLGCAVAAIGALLLWWRWPRGGGAEARPAAVRQTADREVLSADAGPAVRDLAVRTSLSTDAGPAVREPAPSASAAADAGPALSPVAASAIAPPAPAPPADAPARAASRAPHHHRRASHRSRQADHAAARSAPPAAPGHIKVNVLPWAEVRLDGRAVGRTPLELSVAAGRHTLELRNPDTGRTSRRALAVAGGAVVVVASW